jgi:hypothetical protein
MYDSTIVLLYDMLYHFVNNLLLMCLGMQSLTGCESTAGEKFIFLRDSADHTRLHLLRFPFAAVIILSINRFRRKLTNANVFCEDIFYVYIIFIK